MPIIEMDSITPFQKFMKFLSESKSNDNQIKKMKKFYNTFLFLIIKPKKILFKLVPYQRRDNIRNEILLISSIYV